jgi:hypothetical protein
MAYTVIAIARTLSASGEAIGRMVAGECGMRYIDNEIIDQAAALVGVTEKDLAQAEIETRKSLIEQILESFAPASAEVGVPTTQGVRTLPGYERVIVDVINRTASEGNVVIVAHGAAIALAGMQGVLRILVTASSKTRMERLMALGRGKTTAKELIEESDASRAEFLRRFYQLDQESPTDYDLVVNTDRVSVDEAAALIRGMVERAKA